ncbi:MAG TPA: DUF4386 family protein [Actinomycetota bacterium]|nr:DUF4386 family protein [Actinomycetota bacterium]
MATTVQARGATPTGRGAESSDRSLYKAGAVAGFVGTAIGLITNAVHPRNLFGEPTETRLQRIADFGPWLAVHLGFVVALVLGLVTFVAVYRSISGGPSPWARPALALVLVSTAVTAVSFVMDGYGLWGLATAWAEATGAAKSTIALAAGAAESFENALFIGSTILFFGVTPIVAGMALWTDGTYPRWVAVVGIIGGIAGVLAGAINFLAGAVTTFAFNVIFTPASFLITVWFLALSVLLWRRSQTATV